MRLVFATSSYVYGGRARPGFPIILGDDMRPLQPAQAFLTWQLLARGRLLSPLTWEDYGRRLWDYFAFLHANELEWDDVRQSPGLSPVARYRDWSVSELKLRPSTVNGRLRLVISMYEWAKSERLIDRLPFTYAEVARLPQEELLAHARAQGGRKSVPALLEREWTALPEFLSRDQIRTCVVQPLAAGQRILFELMARVGLRACEARTFPKKYVFDPRKRDDCGPHESIRVLLDPRDMWIKFKKARAVDVPYALMLDMHRYTLYERNRLVERGTDSDALVLNNLGRPYTRGALVESFKRLSATTGFRVRPLQLRHSYAIHTLAHLRGNASYTGDPLMYLRDRLGHKSVQTTIVYLRQLEQLAGGVALALDAEFNQLFKIDVNYNKKLNRSGDSR